MDTVVVGAKPAPVASPGPALPSFANFHPLLARCFGGSLASRHSTGVCSTSWVRCMFHLPSILGNARLPRCLWELRWALQNFHGALLIPASPARPCSSLKQTFVLRFNEVYPFSIASTNHLPVTCLTRHLNLGWCDSCRPIDPNSSNMFQVDGGLPLPSSWADFLPIFALGTGGKKYVFDFHSVALSTPKEVILVLAIYLSTLAILKVRNG